MTDPKQTSLALNPLEAAKKAFSRAKADFNLHVQMIMRVEGANLPDARVQAYIEGVEGLALRLVGGKVELKK